MPCMDCSNAFAVPWKLPCTPAGRLRLAWTPLSVVTASDSATPWAEG